MKDPVLKLESISDIQDRIDRVAEDLYSDVDFYSEIPATEIAELLGISFEDEGTWSRSFWACRQTLINQIESYAEHLELLSGLVPDKRYKTLLATARKIEDNPAIADIKLTKKEVALLENAYINLKAPNISNDTTVIFKTLTARNGDELYFEACIGDGGDLFDICSPYDVRDGGGFDSSKYIEVD